MFCKYCGHKLPDDARFCPACGKALENTPAPKKSRPTSPRRSLAPFAVLLVLLFVWNAFYGFFLEGVKKSFITSESFFLYVVPSSLLTSVLVWLAGAVVILVLTGFKKIDPRSVRWRDLLPLALLFAVPFFQWAVAAVFVSHHGIAARMGFVLLLSTEQSFCPPFLLLWVATLIFLLVRSGSLRVTRKKTLICLGILALCSAVLFFLHPLLLSITAEKYAVIGAEDVEWAKLMAANYFAFFWLRGMVALWLTAGLGRGRLGVLGASLPSAAVMLVYFLLAPVLLFGYLGVPELGPPGVTLAMLPATLIGAGVLFLARLRSKKRRSVTDQ